MFCLADITVEVVCFSDVCHKVVIFVRLQRSVTVRIKAPKYVLEQGPQLLPGLCRLRQQHPSHCQHFYLQFRVERSVVLGLGERVDLSLLRLHGRLLRLGCLLVPLLRERVVVGFFSL